MERYFIGPDGRRVMVEGDGERADKLIRTLEELGYKEVQEEEYLRPHTLVVY